MLIEEKYCYLVACGFLQLRKKRMVSEEMDFSFGPCSLSATKKGEWLLKVVIWCRVVPLPHTRFLIECTIPMFLHLLAHAINSQCCGAARVD